jgi:hypothetical protein
MKIFFIISNYGDGLFRVVTCDFSAQKHTPNAENWTQQAEIERHFTQQGSTGVGESR